jgi:hypothetical protein
MPIDDKTKAANTRAAKPSRPYGWLVLLGAAGAVVFFLWRAPTDSPGPAAPTFEEASVDLDEPEPVVGRCAAHGSDRGVLVGKGGGDDADDFAPFAPELGRGGAVADGFVVGVKHEVEGLMHAAVAQLDARGEALRLHGLDRARGDLDPPMVVAHTEGWVAALLEPDASGLSLRLVRGTADGELDWGAELAQGRDESLGYDMALGARSAVVAWDDLDDERGRGVVLVADLALPSLEGGEDAAIVSRPEVDAELPRVIVRPGGFWLAYVASRPSTEGADAGAPERKPDPKPKPKPKPKAKPKGKGEPKDEEEVEDREPAQQIVPSWIELVPLDELGSPEGPPRPVTDETGHVLAYDIEPAADGAALIAWRDDDTPRGAHGGRVSLMVVNASGAGAQQTVAEEHVGAAVPTLASGWLLVPDEHGDAQLAPLSPEGELAAPLQPEPLLGKGQLVAASGDILLHAQPSGRSIRLFTLKCQRPP